MPPSTRRGAVTPLPGPVTLYRKPCPLGSIAARVSRSSRTWAGMAPRDSRHLARERSPAFRRRKIDAVRRATDHVVYEARGFASARPAGVVTW